MPKTVFERPSRFAQSLEMTSKGEWEFSVRRAWFQTRYLTRAIASSTAREEPSHGTNPGTCGGGERRDTRGSFSRRKISPQPHPPRLQRRGSGLKIGPFFSCGFWLPSGSRKAGGSTWGRVFSSGFGQRVMNATEKTWGQAEHRPPVPSPRPRARRMLQQPRCKNLIQH